MLYSKTTKSRRKIRQHLVDKYGDKCHYCGKQLIKVFNQKGDEFWSFEIDHMYPIDRGGSHEVSNLRSSCTRCNKAKKNFILHEWTKIMEMLIAELKIEINHYRKIINNIKKKEGIK